MAENFINHVALVLDASGSMSHLRKKVADVADAQVVDLAKQSKDFNQETRSTVYHFDDRVECLFYDKDVLRLPSIKDTYFRGMGRQTALIDATLMAITDLEKTATIYGNHAFLVYVVTDGQENASRAGGYDLKERIRHLPDNWTMAALVPNQVAAREAIGFGFPPGNVQVWDATTERGVEDAGITISGATQSYFQARSAGQTQSYGLFSPDVTRLHSVGVSDLQPIKGYVAIPIQSHDGGMDIRSFVTKHTGRRYRPGMAFYQLTKPETIQAGKEILVRERGGGDIFGGSRARTILGLPNYEIRVNPATSPKYDIFVQSTSTNRKLVAGTDLVVLL